MGHPHAASRSAWLHVGRAAAALAAGMGVGRFVYTPILPLMLAQAGLSAGGAAKLATANYVGYLIGALAGIFSARLAQSTAVLRGSLLVLVGTLAAMPATHSTTGWVLLRLVAGLASALIFVIAVSSLLGHRHGQPAQLAGWALGGVGAGIVLSGLVVLVLQSVASWQVAWYASAVLAALLAAVSWNLPASSPPGSPARSAAAGEGPRTPTGRWFAVLFVSYSLEGVGYIIAGTFLVAAIGQSSPGWIGGGAWVLVGLAAVPSAAMWARLGRRFSLPDLLVASLAIQAVGIALPALVGGVGAALISAFLFGGTFLGIATLALAAGAQLRFPRSVAMLTAGYSVGQILGPLGVTPLVHHGYRQALVLAAVVVLVAAAAAAVLRTGFPHRMPNVSSVTDHPAAHAARYDR